MLRVPVLILLLLSPPAFGMDGGAILARVDRNLAPLSQQLQSGQSVEIITSEEARPNPDWLTFVVSSKARTGIRQALKPTGTYLMQDICASSHLEKNMAHPIAPFLYTISTMHCMTVSLAADGAGLGTCWGEETALAMLDTAGFPTVEVKRLPHDIQNNFYIAQPVRS